MQADGLTADTTFVSLTRNPNNRQLSFKILAYLSLADLLLLRAQFQRTQTVNHFTQLVCTLCFLGQYLNKIDRSFYFEFYGRDDYEAIERKQVLILAQNSCKLLVGFEQNINQCLGAMSELFGEDVQVCELTDSLVLALTDTEMPMAKLKRENQGVFCKTVFQNFLVASRFQNPLNNYCEDIYEELNSYFEAHEEQYLQSTFMKAVRSPVLSTAIHSLLLTPYRISASNQHEFLIPGNALHNFLVYLYSLTDTHLQATKTYISSITDPLHQWVQFLTRYSIYRNYVIQVQENLQAVFDLYGQLYAEMFGQAGPGYNFWRGAMAKWFLAYRDMQAQFTRTCCGCITELRVNEMLAELASRESSQPEIFMNVNNSMALHSHLLFNADQRLGAFEIGSYFEGQPELSKVLVSEYVEYLVDISIDEQTVHWCGHSGQALGQAYLQFEKCFMKQNQDYFCKILRITEKSQNQYQAITAIMNIDFDFLESVEVKPLTLSKLKQRFLQYLYKIQKKQQSEEALAYSPAINDNILVHFNTQLSLPFAPAADKLPLYSIIPVLEPQQLLALYSAEVEDNCSTQRDDNSQCNVEYFSQHSQDEPPEPQDFGQGVGVHECEALSYSCNNSELTSDTQLKSLSSSTQPKNDSESEQSQQTVSKKFIITIEIQSEDQSEDNSEGSQKQDQADLKQVFDVQSIAADAKIINCS